MKLTIFTLFVIRSIRLLIFYLYLFQLKEYRIDRIRVHLKTNQGKKLLTNPLSLSKWLLLLGLAIGIIDAFSGLIILLLFFLFESLLFLRDIIFHKLILPEIRKRIIIVPVLVIFFTKFFLNISRINVYSLIIVDRIFPLIIAFAFILTNFAFNFYKQFIVIKAKKKLENISGLCVIGITGSYGKSSTKDFLSTILSQKFKVVKNPRSINTAIGVAENILKNVDSQTQILIVEAAAYKKGEIAEIVKIVKPKIGIITAVSNQHLSLFGSQRKLMEAKFELIAGLPKGGLAIFNADSPLSLVLAERAKKIGRKVILVGTKNNVDFQAKDIQQNKFSLEFSLIHDNKIEKFKADLLGAHNIQNLLLSIAVAYGLGLTASQIRKAISLKIKPIEKTMFPKFFNEAVLIDDTFNANPQAVLAALSYLSVYQGKKYLILQPLIELGRQADKSHKEIAKIASSICEEIFLTNDNYFSAFKEGINKNKLSMVKISTAEKIAEILKMKLKKGDVCLFEGKETEKALKIFNL